MPARYCCSYSAIEPRRTFHAMLRASLCGHFMPHDKINGCDNNLESPEMTSALAPLKALLSSGRGIGGSRER